MVVGLCSLWGVWQQLPLLSLRRAMAAAEVLRLLAALGCCRAAAAADTDSHCQRAAAKMKSNADDHKLHNRLQGAPEC